MTPSAIVAAESAPRYSSPRKTLDQVLILYLRAKWPISINFRNIWTRITVWKIYRKIPLFVVLELGELEYPIFLFQRGT